jgi:hypothetical protein
MKPRTKRSATFQPVDWVHVQERRRRVDSRLLDAALAAGVLGNTLS